MKQPALVGETVSDFIYRLCGSDEDKIEQAFFMLNPDHHSPHLIKGVEYEVPSVAEVSPEPESNEVYRWA